MASPPPPPPPPPPPVGEDNWLDYIDQQRRRATSLELRIHVVELYRRAVSAVPGSIRVWIAYCTYFWSLYTEASQRSGPVASWPVEEQVAAASIFSLDDALHLWSEGHEATQYRLSDSHELWNRWIALERELLDRTRTPEGLRRITHLYRNRLAIPHATWDDTSSAFSSFLSEYNPAAYEDTMRAVTEQSRRAKSIYARRDGMEMALRAAARSGDDDALRLATSNYLDWETANALAEKQDKAIAIRIALGLFARALSGIFSADDLVWTDCIVFVSQLRKELADAPGRGERNDDIARAIPNDLDILQRAVQHCPWSGSLWARYIVCGEQVGLSFADLERIKHAATNSSLDRDGMTAVVEMYSAWCGYLRRSAMDPSAPDEAVDLADSGLVAALEAVQVWGERRFGSAYQGDPNFRLERIMIQHLTDKHGAIDEARQQWEKLAGKDLHANDYSFWLSYYSWELNLFEAQTGSRASNRSPTPAATTTAARSMRSPLQAARVLRRALQNLHLNWPERIMDIYGRHCNDFQSADVLHEAYDDIHKLQKQLTKHRKEAAALQAATQAQAEAEAAEAEAQAASRARQATAESHAASQAGHRSTSEPQHESPSGAKRKWEQANAADASTEAASKRAKPDGTNAETSQAQSAALKRDRENTSVYVSNLPVDVTSTKLKHYFRDYGHVNNIQLKQEADGKSSVALIEFRSAEDVDSALIRDGKYFGEQTISVKPAAGVTLFVTNFPPTADDAYLRSLFKDCGVIFGIRWPSLKFNTHRRFCYVAFREAAAAAQAVSRFDGKILEGKYKISVQFSDPLRKKSREGAAEDGREVHVKYLGSDMDEKGVEALFAKYGSVERVRLLRNIGGQSRGSAFVVLSSKEEAEHAVAELDKAKIGSHILAVELSVVSKHKPVARETSIVSGSKDADADEGTTPASEASGPKENGARPTSATSATSAAATATSANREAAKNRTFALLGIPETVNIDRVRALLQPYGHIVKLMLRADHGGAIVEYADAAAAGKAEMALTGTEIDGHVLRTGSVAALFHSRPEVRAERTEGAPPKRSADGAVSAPTAAPAPKATLNAAIMVPRVRRPIQGKGTKKAALSMPGFRPAPAAVNGTAGNGSATVPPVKKSNADFRALFLGGGGTKADGVSDKKDEAKMAVANDSKMDVDVAVNGH